jgi:hypothetical protein
MPLHVHEFGFFSRRPTRNIVHAVQEKVHQSASVLLNRATFVPYRALLTVADFLQAACSFITSLLNSAQSLRQVLADVFFHSFMTFFGGIGSANS